MEDTPGQWTNIRDLMQALPPTIGFINSHSSELNKTHAAAPSEIGGWRQGWKITNNPVARSIVRISRAPIRQVFLLQSP